MSAPTPAPGDDRPREGYYPDPSIPGYVRYWNGASWVPGTSRPAPSDGEPLAAPGAAPATPATPASLEETGPHFFDEDPEPAAPEAAEPPAPAEEPDRPAPAETQHGSRPEPATAWGADRSRQAGFGRDQGRVSWGSQRAGDPRTSGDQPTRSDGDSARTASTDGTATIPPADDEAPDGTMVFRRANANANPEPTEAEGTMKFRSPLAGRGGRSGSAGAVDDGTGRPYGSPRTNAQAAAQQALGLNPQANPQTASESPSGPRQSPQQGPQQGPGQGPQTAPPAAASPAPPNPPAQRQPTSPQQPPAAHQQPTAHQPSAPVPAHPDDPGGAFSQQAAPAQTPLSAGTGGGQPSWAQQVGQLAGADGEQRVAPWKPVSEDPFQAAARAQAAARPAGLGKRLAARLLDTIVVLAVTGAVAVPFGTKAIDHVNEKIDAAKQSGETVTVWLLDGTTSVYFGIILGVLLVCGVLYEALPTAKWGRTLGKKLLGLEVRDIEGHEPPTFGLAVRRWLVYSIPGLLGVGVVGVLWCVFDRPWRQCWHDKAAHTFVAG
ncbi:RDD family protein [Streptomyces sp. NPDC046862]|uniref:RDD family protein n=1 Tax=Streptomyces sp. NPDC046862 TaxID=3154603 RepID=UPI0034531F11